MTGVQTCALPILPVLTAVIGAQGLLPIIVGNLVISVLMVPITIVLLGQMDGTNSDYLDLI